MWDAFKYIVALHAENKHILTNPVFAKILNCEIKEIKKKVIGPSGHEAAATQSGRYILTRHMAIAETAKDILEKTFYEDFDEIYADIVRAASELHAIGSHVHMLHKFEDLSNYFFEKGQEELGIRLAKSLVEANPMNPFLRVRLSLLYRKSNDAQKGAKVFWDAPREIKRDRAFYFEWSVAEGNLKNRGLATWLASVSLADDIEKNPPDNESAKLSLAGTGIGLQKLYDKYNDRTFIEALGACAQLGLKLKLDTVSRGYFLGYERKSQEAEVAEVEDEIALNHLIKGIKKAWEVREEELPEFVPSPDKLKYSGLKYLLQFSH